MKFLLAYTLLQHKLARSPNTEELFQFFKDNKIDYDRERLKKFICNLGNGELTPLLQKYNCKMKMDKDVVTEIIFSLSPTSNTEHEILVAAPECFNEMQSPVETTSG